MELLTESLNKLLAEVGTHSTDAERKACADKLRFLIIAYGKAQAVQAVQLERKVFEAMGLVAVDGAALEKLNANMSRLTADAYDAMQPHEKAWLDAGLVAQPYNAANEATIDPAGRSFRVPDPDLQALLDDTEALLHPGGANMDVGISWSNSLKVVVDRLTVGSKVYQRSEEDGDLTREQYVRYRVHTVIDKVVGRQWLGKLKRGAALKDVVVEDTEGGTTATQTFQALETEFSCRLATNDQQALLDMTDNEIALYFKRRIEEGKAK